MKYWQQDSYWQRQRKIKVRRETSPSITDGNISRDIPKNTQTAAAALPHDHLAPSMQARPGVLAAELEGRILTIQYDVRKISLREIKHIIAEQQLSASENLWERLRCFISQYKESVRREEQLIDYGWDTWIQDAYVSRYRLRRHGRRDDRLTNWRQYEENHQDQIRETAGQSQDQGQHQ